MERKGGNETDTKRLLPLSLSLLHSHGQEGRREREKREVSDSQCFPSDGGTQQHPPVRRQSDHPLGRRRKGGGERRHRMDAGRARDMRREQEIKEREKSERVRQECVSKRE